MTNYKIHKFPRSRIATNDVCAIGLTKHHVAALIEFDVTASKGKIRDYKNSGKEISFTAWLIKVISITIRDYENVSAFLQGKRKIMVFDDINVSILVEKELNGTKIPIPLVIEKTQERDLESITAQIRNAKEQKLTKKDIVLKNRSGRYERLYYYLPGFIRRNFWRILLKRPKIAFKKMGNVAITSVGMRGNINGWFIPIAVHPVCFGISNITKKPVVINDNVEIREILNMTVLLDHDVIDGADMARFINKLSQNIESGIEL